MVFPQITVLSPNGLRVYEGPKALSKVSQTRCCPKPAILLAGLSSLLFYWALRYYYVTNCLGSKWFWGNREIIGGVAGKIS